VELDLSSDKDVVMEQILENIHHTPLGQVLKRIASLPEVRQEKVLDLRRKITEGRYDVSERLDMALDRVLEDLTT
jgi:anti-sigma28 factor (negative regulator of flagellin synthesis)